MSLSAGFFFSPQKLTFMEVGVHTGFKVMLQIYNFFDFIHLNNTVVFNISRKRVFLHLGWIHLGCTIMRLAWTTVFNLLLGCANLSDYLKSKNLQLMD